MRAWILATLVVALVAASGCAARRTRISPADQRCSTAIDATRDETPGSNERFLAAQSACAGLGREADLRAAETAAFDRERQALAQVDRASPDARRVTDNFIARWRPRLTDAEVADLRRRLPTDQRAARPAATARPESTRTREPQTVREIFEHNARSIHASNLATLQKACLRRFGASAHARCGRLLQVYENAVARADSLETTCMLCAVHGHQDAPELCFVADALPCPWIDLPTVCAILVRGEAFETWPRECRALVTR